MVFHEQIGAAILGAAQVGGQAFASFIKPSVQEITPVIRQEIQQGIKETLPTIRTETIQFIQQGGQAAGQAAAAAVKPSVEAFTPLALIAGGTILAVALVRR